jgi:hypothetical protein
MVSGVHHVQAERHGPATCPCPLRGRAPFRGRPGLARLQAARAGRRVQSRLVSYPLLGDVGAGRLSDDRIGPGHLWFGASLAGNDRIADTLAVAGVRADLSHDPLGTAVLCLRDPDNIAPEFFEEIAPGAVSRAGTGRAVRTGAGP